jgi:hypothetical protein
MSDSEAELILAGATWELTMGMITELTKKVWALEDEVERLKGRAAGLTDDTRCPLTGEHRALVWRAVRLG